MPLEVNNTYLDGATTLTRVGPSIWPGSYSGCRDEYLAGRSTAWLGITLSASPVYDVYGPDAIAFWNQVAVNRDFGRFPEGTSKHVLLTNEDGLMIADGVVLKVADDRYRSYWLAPVLDFFVRTSGLDVSGEYITDEFFFQLDGPRSLEILEKASGADIHDLRFAHNKRIEFCDAETTVHRLGMSGALAYEVHGNSRDATAVYQRLREVLDEFGGRPQGIENYITVNHTPAGYPNQYLHFAFPLHDSGPELAAFIDSVPQTRSVPFGSAGDRLENFFATPFDVGWGYLVNFDHEFRGRDALKAIAENPPRTAVTLEWDADDVADVFASQFRGTDVEPYDPIETWPRHPDEQFTLPIRGDYVLADERKIGIATGRTVAYYERRMISLATIEKEYAQEGQQVTVLWGDQGWPTKKIRATVARFPYYNGEYRNETFDTSAIPRAPQAG